MKILFLVVLFGLISLSQAVECTRKATADCFRQHYKEIRPCGEDESPKINTTTCCPTCKPRESEKTCDKRPEEIPKCEGEKPKIGEDNCPTCMPRNGRPTAPDCTREDIEDCPPTSTLEPCPTGVKPERDEDCCLPCRPVPPCNQTQLAECDPSELPFCKPEEQPKFDFDTCCRTCKPPIPGTGQGPSNGRCTRENFSRCILHTPICEEGEEPTFNELYCCPSCKRPETTCRVEDVVACKKSIPDCAEGEKPVQVEGECCLTCRPRRPDCDPECKHFEVCVKRRNETDSICVKKSIIKRIIRFAKNHNLTREELKDIILELIERYCERNEHSKRCKKFREFFENLDVDSGEVVSEGDEVEIIVGDDDDDESAKRVADSAALLIEDALKDDPDFPLDNPDETSEDKTEDKDASSSSILAISWIVLAISLFSC